jgi:hypothetical protein
VGVDPSKAAIDIDQARGITIEGFQITTSGMPLVSNSGGGVGVRVHASDAILHRNTIFDNRTGVSITLGPGDAPELLNNVIWANVGSAIEVRGQVDVPVEVTNNTIVFNGEGVRLVDTGTGTPRLANILNNIIVGSTGAGIRSLNTAGATIDFNDVYQNLGGNYVNVAQIGEHNISKDPLFAEPVSRPLTGRPDPDLANWELGAFSPAIDAGLGDEDLNFNGILDVDLEEDENENGVLDAPPELDRNSRTRFDDVNVLNTGLGIPDYVDLGAFERQVDSSGEPGSFDTARASSAKSTKRRSTSAVASASGIRLASATAFSTLDVVVAANTTTPPSTTISRIDFGSIASRSEDAVTVVDSLLTGTGYWPAPDLGRYRPEPISAEALDDLLEKRDRRGIKR